MTLLDGGDNAARRARYLRSLPISRLKLWLVPILFVVDYCRCELIVNESLLQVGVVPILDLVARAIA